MPDITAIMRKLLFLGLGLLSLVSCKENTSEKASEADLAAHYESFGAKLEKEGFKNPKEMEELYSGLKKGDTVEVKFQAPVNSVCKMKGCWMVLDLPGEEDPRVTFKDYGFFCAERHRRPGSDRFRKGFSERNFGRRSKAFCKRWRKQ